MGVARREWGMAASKRKSSYQNSGDLYRKGVGAVASNSYYVGPHNKRSEHRERSRSFVPKVIKGSELH